MAGAIYRPEQKHPEASQRVLNPDAAKGLNHGLAGPHPEKESPRTVYDVKELHRRLHGFADNELKQIPVMPAGVRLETDATYVNLRDRVPTEFHAKGDEDTGEQDFFIPKAEVPYQIWNRLLAAVGSPQPMS
jgi:hypothetical protein